MRGEPAGTLHQISQRLACVYSVDSWRVDFSADADECCVLLYRQGKVSPPKYSEHIAGAQSPIVLGCGIIDGIAQIESDQTGAQVMIVQPFHHCVVPVDLCVSPAYVRHQIGVRDIRWITGLVGDRRILPAPNLLFRLPLFPFPAVYLLTIPATHWPIIRRYREAGSLFLRSRTKNTVRPLLELIGSQRRAT